MFSIQEIVEASPEYRRLREENDKLLGIIAFSNIDCLYCGLSRADMARCGYGFPGCGRADDMLIAPEEIQRKYGPKEEVEGE
jgi:hypothetical protein